MGIVRSIRVIYIAFNHTVYAIQCKARYSTLSLFLRSEFLDCFDLGVLVVFSGREDFSGTGVNDDLERHRIIQFCQIQKYIKETNDINILPTTNKSGYLDLTASETRFEFSNKKTTPKPRYDVNTTSLLNQWSGIPVKNR